MSGLLCLCADNTAGSLCKQIKLLNNQPVQLQRLSVQEISNRTLFPSAGAIKFHKFVAAFSYKFYHQKEKISKILHDALSLSLFFFFFVQNNYYSFPPLINCKLWSPDGHQSEPFPPFLTKFVFIPMFSHLSSCLKKLNVHMLQQYHYFKQPSWLMFEGFLLTNGWNWTAPLSFQFSSNDLSRLTG